MSDVLRRLIDRTRPLGNHARKHLRAAEKYGDLLLERLEQAGALQRVPLDRTSPALKEAFLQVAEAGRDPTEALALVGTYYSIQYLHFGSRSLERLAMDLAERPEPRKAYRAFIRRTEEEFTSLVSAYIRRVLRLLIPPHLTAPFVICAVGTRGHQDDIDVAVLDEGGPAREELDRVFGRLTVQMLRHASAFDHYLAERVGAQGYCLSPAELSRLLHRGRLDFVVVTELMRAEPLVGNRGLYRQLVRDVIAPFIYRPGRDNSRHELYLRSLLGEIRSLLLRPAPAGSINPKDDALRLIMALTLSFKTIEGLESTRTRELLRALRSTRPELRAWVSRLDRSLLFLETLRHVVQLLIAQEEAIDVDSPRGREQLNRVAAVMGYRDGIGFRAADHLLVHYQEAVREVREATEPLMDAVTRHLREKSRFARWMGGVGLGDRAPRPALELALGARAFRGVRFWDDLLEAFTDPEGGLLDAFVADYVGARPAERRRFAQEYADWGRQAPYALFNLLIWLTEKSRGRTGIDPAREITDAYLERLGRRHEDVRAISRVFRFYPDLTNRLLLTLDRDQLARLHDKLDDPIGDPMVAAARDRLRDLVRIHRRSSRYIKRVLARLTVRHPATVLALSDDRTLATLAQGRHAEAERQLDREKQKALLGDYYDMEFLRIAVSTLRGRKSDRVRREFGELTERYLRSTLDICLRQVEQEAGTRMLHRDRLGLFLAGGHARRRPYDEDYDVIAVIDSREEEEMRLAEKAVARLNRQIARRGIIAQYHISGRFGRFVISFDELADFLGSTEEDLLVDLHQLVGGHLVIGSSTVTQVMEARILEPFVFDRAEAFVQRTMEEISERRRLFRPLPEEMIHLKEMPGGMREIDLVFAMAKVRARIAFPAEDQVVDRLSERDPSRRDIFTRLRAANDFFVALRSAYRVSVAGSDVIERAFLTEPARILRVRDWGGKTGAERLFERIHQVAEQARQAIDAYIDSL